MSTFTPFEEKMESAGVPAAAVKAFSRCYEALVSNHSGMIPEMDIQPADQVEDWQDITASTPAADKDLISQCVCIKLNGGLGTSMGLQKAKSLLKVKGEDTFLDLIVRQVKHLRSISGTPVRLLLMNSFSTSADTLAYLEKYASDGFADPAQVELMQNRVPKILADGLAPASCPQPRGLRPAGGGIPADRHRRLPPAHGLRYDHPVPARPPVGHAGCGACSRRPLPDCGEPLPEARGRHRHPGRRGNPALPAGAPRHAMVLLAADTFCGPERRTPEPPPDGRLNRRGQPALHDSRQPGNAGPCGPAARQHPAMLRLW